MDNIRPVSADDPVVAIIAADSGIHSEAGHLVTTYAGACRARVVNCASVTIITYCPVRLIVGLTATPSIAGIRVVTGRIAGAAARRAARLEAIVGAASRTVAGVLIGALSSWITAVCA